MPISLRRPPLNEALLNQILDTGHGTGIDVQSLKGVIHDEEAVTPYELLLADYAGTSREGVLRQHLGKVRFVAGDFWAARDDFAAALQLRRAQGAGADLIEFFAHRAQSRRPRDHPGGTIPEPSAGFIKPAGGTDAPEYLLNPDSGCPQVPTDAPQAQRATGQRS